MAVSGIFEDIVVEPPTAQRPHPPIWVAGASSPSIRRAAARSFSLILDQYAAPDIIGERIALYRAEREASGTIFRSDAGGRGPPSLRREKCSRQGNRIGTARRVHEAHGRGVAGSRRQCGFARPRVYRQSGRHRGTADEICDKLAALNRAGAEYVLLSVSGSSREQLRRFAREVMPEFSRAGSLAPQLAAVPTRAAMRLRGGDFRGPGGM